MSTVPPPVVMLSSIGAPFAGFWIRVVALLIDWVILLIPNLMFAVVFGESLGQLVGILFAIGYFTLLQGGKWQASLGKRLVGIHVMRTNGENITYLRAFGRYWGAVLSGLILFIGYIMAGLTREKTALHDVICDTRVVYGKR